MKQKYWNRWLKKQTAFLAAAILSVSTLSASGGFITYAQEKSVSEEENRIFPKEITVENPTELKNIKLEDSEYGSYSWEDDSLLADQAEQTFTVVLKVKDGVDLSAEKDYDEKTGTLKGKVVVLVTSLKELEEEISAEDPVTTEEAENPEETTVTEITEKPEVTEIPGIPEESAVTEVPDVPVETDITEAPEEPTITEVPANPEEPVITEKPEAQQEPTVTETPEMPEEPGITEEPTSPEIVDIFSSETVEDSRATVIDTDLNAQEQLRMAEVNHSSNGITVTGKELPWYVQFRATESVGFEFSNESDAEIFKSFNFELWDLVHDKKYEIPDGSYVSVTIPVIEGYNYTVEHILENGAIETIIPAVEGSVLTFSAHSFSPFGIAGSISIVDPLDQITATPTPTPTAVPTQAANTSVSGATVTPTPTVRPASSQNTESTRTVSPTPTVTRAANTGDNTQIIPLIVLIGAAVVLIVLLVILKNKRSKK